jgi:hypothetical protein
VISLYPSPQGFPATGAVINPFVESQNVRTMLHPSINEPAYHYPFSWLEETVEVTLNPEQTSLKTIASSQLETIIDQFREETRQAANCIKQKVYSLTAPEEIKAAVGQCYTSIHILRQQALDNLQNYARNSVLVKAGQTILRLIEELASAIRKRYEAYLPAPPEEGQGSAVLPGTLFKLLPKLSGRQIAVLLRAAFDAGVIAAQSLKKMFKLITPLFIYAQNAGIVR